MESTLLRKPCFAEEDDGLASIAEFSNARRYPVFSRLAGYSAASLNCSSPGSVRRFEDGIHSPRSPHFLEACTLCKKLLGGNRDIFMYRGDVPFCSEECRGEQIQADEAMEKSLSLKSMRTKKSTSAQQSASSSPDKSQKFRAGTVAAA